MWQLLSKSTWRSASRSITQHTNATIPVSAFKRNATTASQWKRTATLWDSDKPAQTSDSPVSQHRSRRHEKQSSSTKNQSLAYVHSKEKTNRHKAKDRSSRRADSEKDTKVPQKLKHLYAKTDDSYVVSSRVKRLLSVSDVDEAISYLSQVPVSLQSAPAWNIIFRHCAQEGRANHAERCFAQMRKRGISPNEMTFTHLLFALYKSTTPTMVERAEHWIERMKDDYRIQPNIHHMNVLFQVYEKSKKPLDEVLDKMESMPFKPDQVSYTIALRIASQENAESVIKVWSKVQATLKESMDDSNGTEASPSVLAQKAALVFIEQDEDEHPQETKFELDDTLVTTFLNSLTKTATKTEHLLLAVRTMEQIYGILPSVATKWLAKRKTPEELPAIQTCPLSIKVLDSILRFSGGVGQYKLGLQYYKLGMKKYPSLVPDQHILNNVKQLERELDTYYKNRRTQDHRSVNANYVPGI